MRLLLFAIVFALPFQALADSFRGIANADWKQRSDRIAIAQAYQNKIRVLLDSIPTPKPKDVEWVNAESKAITSLKSQSDQRSIALYTSLEFQHIKVREGFESLANWFKCAGDAKDLRQEVYCWAGASLQMLDEDVFNYGLVKLKKAGLASNSFDGMPIYDDGGIAVFAKMFAQYIHARVTMSYLKGDLGR